VVKAALLTAMAAGLGEDKEIAQTQSYGPEARGGACRSDVVISDSPIEYMKPLKIDTFVVMSQPAMDQYGKDLDPENTAILADTTLVTDIPAGAGKVHRIMATDIAEKEFGAALFANIIMLGALAAITGMVGVEALEGALEGNVPPKTLQINRDALKRGYELGRQALGVD
jgi:2-oxoglutarate ferredoxin oxidoreductase subunit gamma